MSSKGTVLLLKAEGSGVDEYREVLGARFGPEIGFRSISPLEFKFVNGPRIRAVLDSPDAYDGVVFTSQRAVDAVRLQFQDLPEDLKARWAESKTCYVPGEATRQKAEEMGFARISGAESGNAENLSNHILAAEKGARLLFPCSGLKRDTLPEKLKDSHVVLDQITAYETVQSEGLEKDLEAVEGPILAVVFFSPSGVKFGVPPLKKLVKAKWPFLVAIGSTTGSYLKNCGLGAVYESSSPSPEGVKDVLEAIL